MMVLGHDIEYDLSVYMIWVCFCFCCLLSQCCHGFISHGGEGVWWMRRTMAFAMCCKCAVLVRNHIDVLRMCFLSRPCSFRRRKIQRWFLWLQDVRTHSFIFSIWLNLVYRLWLQENDVSMYLPSHLPRFHLCYEYSWPHLIVWINASYLCGPFFASFSS